MSVVLPFRNAGSFLEAALRHLERLDRSRCTYQFVLVDDHSTDDSLEIARGWTPHPQDAVAVISSPAPGVAEARDAAVAACVGAYVWFADADDEWSPTVVTAMLTSALEDSADIVVCNAAKVTHDGRHRGAITDAPLRETMTGHEAFLRLLEGRMQGHLWNKLFARRILSGDDFPRTRAHSDLGGVLSLARRARTVSSVPSCLYTYVKHDGSILNGVSFSPGDLVHCLGIASREAESIAGGPEVGRPLLHFKYRNVVIPIANELARREQTMSRAELRREASDNARRVRPSEVAALVGSRHFSLAAQALLLLTSPVLYTAVFRRLRAASLVTAAGAAPH